MVNTFLFRLILCSCSTKNLEAHLEHLGIDPQHLYFKL